MLDRVEVKVQLEPTTQAEIRKRLRSAEPSEAIAERVAIARERSARRLQGTPWRLNSEIPHCELRRSYLPKPGALREVEHAMELGKISDRSVDRVLRVAWTMTDLAARERPDKDEVHEALHPLLGEGRV